MSIKGVNLGSGQRRFESVIGVVDWCNVDCVSRPPDQVPDLICDVGKERLPFEDGSVDYCVLHQVYEHFHLAEGHAALRECFRVLRPGGSIILTVPDMRALAERWLLGQITDYIYMVNIFGAWQGQPGDAHAWGYSLESLIKDLREAVPGAIVKKFDWRTIPSASIARDWWIISAEIVK